MVRRAGKSPPGGASRARPAPRQQRPEEQHGAAQPADHGAVRLVLHDLATPYAKRRGADALNRGAQIDQQARHDLDVADARHVREHALFGGQQAGGEQREGAVLVALDVNGA